MITESVPLINYPIRKPIPSYFSPKPEFLQLEPVISGFILITDPKNLANVRFAERHVFLCDDAPFQSADSKKFKQRDGSWQKLWELLESFMLLVR